MDFLTAREASELWGISQRRVATYCSEERIKGAEMKGNMWFIPQNTQKPNDVKIAKFQQKAPANIKPFIKWAGGKTQILDNIRMKYPDKLGKSVTKYAEPFVGGGAVLFDILSNYNVDEVYISDINHELILTYKTIRNNINELISSLILLEKTYLSATEDHRKRIYYDNRVKFNTLRLQNSVSPELAALFIFLNRTCFNGLYRVNSKGEFNVPQGSYKNPCICDETNLLAVSERLRNVRIICGDYKESESFIDKNTFAYFDPPYRPLSISSNFTSYTQNGFGDKDQIELAHFIDKLNERGAFIIASNSDPKNTNEEDNFFDELYARHKIFRISASRAINSAGKGRGKINELLISNF